MQIERIESVALLRMQAGKANAMSETWLERMSALLDQVDAERPRALVITGDGRSFSAGLDLPFLIDLPAARMAAFMDRFGAVMLRLFRLPLPVVAAIDGHAVAGGCVLAMQADVRIAARGSSKIGLNEVQIGLGLPAVILETLRSQVPAESLRPIALEGRLFAPDEAQKIGLVHEVVAPEKLIDRALEKARELGALPGQGFRLVKESLRRPTAEAIQAAGDADRDAWIAGFRAGETQRVLRDVVERLRKK